MRIPFFSPPATQQTGNSEPEIVPEGRYTREYFLKHCGGAQLFGIHGYQLRAALQRSLHYAQISPGNAVLDVGFGRGELLFECHKLGATCYGIDYATQAVMIAKEFMARNDIQNVELMQSTLPDLGFNQREFDQIFFLDVIEHIYEPVVQQTLDSIAERLKVGGMLIVHTDNRFYKRSRFQS